MLLHRESLRGSSVICEGVSCAWTVINARKNKSTYGPRILMNVARVETNTVRIRGVALVEVIRAFCGDCRVPMFSSITN